MENAIWGSEKNGQLSYLLLQASLFAEEGISTRELTDTLEISRTTLKERLHELEAQGYLDSRKAGRVIYYRLNLNSILNT